MTLHRKNAAGEDELVVEIEEGDLLTLEEFTEKCCARVDKVDLIRFICDSRLVFVR